MGDAHTEARIEDTMTSPTPITSDDVLPDIEHHFRVTAGPGAGKTHWLAKHISHVTRCSKRLTPCSRIAVISYTNVAVREIVSKLGTGADGVDASTIHSFLFRNLVRPYAHLLKHTDGSDLVAHQLVDTHGEHYPSFDHLNSWLDGHGKRSLLFQTEALSVLKQSVQRLTVRVDAQNRPFLVSCNDRIPPSIAPLMTPESLLAYKRRFWLIGTVDHEDVLYFAYRLLDEFPTLRQFLSARFPYLFIDEFQDTLPVQAAIVKWLAAAGTVVGVIGDPEQAIYGFLDASATHFRDFQLDGHRNYEISGNRRSTDAIVKFLNRVRTDGLQQQTIRTDVGTAPLIYGGSLADALDHARNGVQPLVLARKHDGVTRARRAETGRNDDPWEVLQDADADRFRFLNHLAIAADLAQRRFFDIAMQRLVQGISSRKGFREPLQFDQPVDLVMRRSLALSLLEHLVHSHDGLLNKTALDVYNSVSDHAPKCLKGLKLKGVKAGKFQTAAAACLYSDLVLALKTPDETRMTRTIHQAKGTESSAVFVILDDGQAKHILTPTAGDEEQRVTYVALSRARDNLCIYCPKIDLLPEFAAIGATTMVLGTPPAPKKRATRKASKPT